MMEYRPIPFSDGVYTISIPNCPTDGTISVYDKVIIELDDRIDELEAENQQLHEQVDKLEDTVSYLRNASALLHLERKHSKELREQVERPDLFIEKDFKSHAGESLSWKIECDSLTDGDIKTLAMLIAKNVEPFNHVYGIPTGGERIAKAMERYKTTNGKLLIVDDVFTTGKSMMDARDMQNRADVIGAVIFSRGNAPSWVTALFQLSATCPEAMQLREQVERQQSRIDSCNAMLDKHDEFFLYINEVLEMYGNTHTYKAERTGGVLAGCPRGKSPKPEHLVFEARHAIKRLFEMHGKPVPDWVSDYKESLFAKVERLEQELSECRENEKHLKDLL